MNQCVRSVLHNGPQGSSQLKSSLPITRERGESNIRSNGLRSFSNRLIRKTKSLNSNGRFSIYRSNNHVAIYKCEICREATRVLYWKPKAYKHDNQEVTAAKERHEELPNKHKKKNKEKRRETAGLIIPPSRTPTTSAGQQQRSIAKLSTLLQLPSTTSQPSKLNQFLK